MRLALGVVLALGAAPVAFAAQVTFDFEDPAKYGYPDSLCVNSPAPPLFNRPEYGFQTQDYIEDPAGCDEGVYGGGFGSDSRLTAGINSTDSNLLRFSWVDPTDNRSWLRLPAYTASGQAVLNASPTVHLGVGSSIEMKVAVYGMDENEWESTSGQLEFGLIIRETGENLPLGANGGLTGDLEFVGIDSKGYGVDPDDDPNTPVGGTTISHHGTFAWTTLKWTFIDVSGEVKVEVSVNGGTPVQKDIIGFTGDSVLLADFDRGTLDSLAIRKPEADTPTKKWFVWIDDIVIDAPGVVDPVAIAGTVLEVMTEVTVVNISDDATQVTLYRNATEVLGTAYAPFTNNAHTFTGLVLAADQSLTATQVIGGVESDPSGAAVVQTVVIWHENFDSYANQAAFNAVWQITGNTTEPERIMWSNLAAASCPKSAREPGAIGGTTASRARVAATIPGAPEAGGYDGSDAVPLNVTWWFRHELGAVPHNARNWLSLQSWSGNAYESGTRRAELALGNYNALPGGTTVYNCRTYPGDWSLLDDGPVGNENAARKPNEWNKMQIRVKTGTVDFLVNDVLYKTVFRPNPNDKYDSIVIGSGLTNGDNNAWYDSITVSYGDPIVETYPPPLPEPTVVGPLLPDLYPTTVTVNDLRADATHVRVWADATLIGSTTLSGETTKDVNVSSIPNNSRITATQVLPEGESCRSSYAGVLAAFPAPVVSVPISGGAITVTVTDLHSNATSVKVYINGSPVLPSTPVTGGQPSVVVTVPELVDDDLVQATQIVNGFESPLSTPAVRVYTQGVGALRVAIGVREVSGASGPVGADGGGAGAIEFIGYTNLSGAPGGKALVPGGSWQQITFDPATDLIRNCNNGNGILDGPSHPWYTLEHIAFTIDPDHPKRGPYAVYIDDITNGGVTFGGFEAYTAPTVNGTVMFRQPTFSGGTAEFLESTPDSTTVTNEQARTGNNSLKVEWAWKDEQTTNWLRLSTYNAINQPNPQVNLSGPVTMWMLLCGAPEVFVGNILVDGGDTVAVIGVSAAADSVQVYTDGDPTPIGSAAGNGMATVNVTGLSLATGQVITVTQTVGGAEGCTGASVTVGDCAQIPAVGLTGPLVNLDEEVTVTGIDESAQQVSVYELGNPTLIGTTSAGGTGTISVPVTALSTGQVIVATQTIEGLEGCLPTSGMVVGSGITSTLRIALGVREPDSPVGDELEWVGASGPAGGPVAPTQVITPGSGWKTLTFDHTNLVQAFTGNGIVQPNVEGVVRIDHLAIIRDVGSTDTGPYVLYIDEITNGIATLQGFENAPPGSEVWFQEPTFSGSTAIHLLSQPNVAGVDASQAAVGNQSYRTEWQFVDDDSARWLRLVTYFVPESEIEVDLTQGVTMRVMLAPVPTVPVCNDPPQDVDGDGDGDVDLLDFGVFSQCFNGPNRPYASVLPEMLAKCACLDQDSDDDVDLVDFGVFSACFNGPNRAPACE
ncbi:MAG: hypothetical protein JXA69_20145 [Phycisphaerae bacterium]|nr:hypothetical protein [Phycisphaerae bacterium]